MDPDGYLNACDHKRWMLAVFRGWYKNSREHLPTDMQAFGDLLAGGLKGSLPQTTRTYIDFIATAYASYRREAT